MQNVMSGMMSNILQVGGGSVGSRMWEAEGEKSTFVTFHF